MVECVEEEAPENISIENRKAKWALIVYSFAITRNFSEIFFKPYTSIRDKKFEVFNGIRLMMMLWIILGHCYVMGSIYGFTNPSLK